MKKFLCVFLAMFTLTLTGCGGEKEVYSGDRYEVSYDSDKWELAFEDDYGMVSFKRKGFDNVHFNVCRYRPNCTLVNEGNIDINERFERNKERSEANGYIWDGGEILDIDGREWGREEYHFEVQGDMFKLVDFRQYGAPYAYTLYFTSDIDSFDKCIKDFEEIFDSFKITE